MGAFCAHQLGAQEIESSEEILVKAKFTEEEFLSKLDAGDPDTVSFGVASATTLSEESLKRNLSTTLGETVASQPGVRASSYSPGASRPIIRGLDGFRALTLLDGLSSLDIGDESPDHGAAIDPALAEKIEIHRGPSALRFGSGAIGGAVNVTSNIRPNLEGEEDIDVYGSLGYNTQGDAFQHALGVTVQDKYWAINLYNGELQADDVSIPGRARTDEYEAAEAFQVDLGSGPETVLNPDGTLLNSFFNSATRSIGASVGIPDKIEFGVSYVRIESDYGVPFFFTEPGGEFGRTVIETELDRIDAELSIYADENWGPFTELSVKFTHGDYQQAEIFTEFETANLTGSGDSEVEVAFDRQAIDSRVELFNGNKGSFLKGVSGFQVANNQVNAAREGTNFLLNQEVNSIYTTQKATWENGNLK